MVFSCFAVYVLANNTRVVPNFESCMVALLETMYYSHSYIYTGCPKQKYTQANLIAFKMVKYIAISFSDIVYEVFV